MLLSGNGEQRHHDHSPAPAAKARMGRRSVAYMRWSEEMQYRDPQTGRDENARLNRSPSKSTAREQARQSIGVRKILVRISRLTPTQCYSLWFVYPQIDDEIKIDNPPGRICAHRYVSRVRALRSGQHVNMTGSAVRITPTKYRCAMPEPDARGLKNRDSLPVKLCARARSGGKTWSLPAVNSKLEINFGNRVTSVCFGNTAWPSEAGVGNELLTVWLGSAGDVLPGNDIAGRIPVVCPSNGGNLSRAVARLSGGWGTNALDAACGMIFHR